MALARRQEGRNPLQHLHSYAMDVIPMLLSLEDERENVRRCTDLLANVTGKPV